MRIAAYIIAAALVATVAAAAAQTIQAAGERISAAVDARNVAIAQVTK